MKAKLFYCVLVTLLCGISFGQYPEQPFAPSEKSETILYEQPDRAERIFEDSSGTYVIRFTYGMFEGWTPVDATDDEIRYSAFIEVFKLENCVQTRIGKGFMGTYSPKGCIYDDAEYLISEAYKIERRSDRSRGRR